MEDCCCKPLDAHVWGDASQPTAYGSGTGPGRNYSSPPLIGSGGAAVPKQGDWIKVSVCSRGGYGILADGSLWGWGAARTIGDGTINASLTPVRIGSDSWSHVSTCDSHTLGIKQDGTLWGWRHAYRTASEGGAYQTPATQYAPATAWLGNGTRETGRFSKIPVRISSTVDHVDVYGDLASRMESESLAVASGGWQPVSVFPRYQSGGEPTHGSGLQCQCTFFYEVSAISTTSVVFSETPTVEVVPQNGDDQRPGYSPPTIAVTRRENGTVLASLASGGAKHTVAPIIRLRTATQTVTLSVIQMRRTNAEATVISGGAGYTHSADDRLVLVARFFQYVIYDIVVGTLSLSPSSVTSVSLPQTIVAPQGTLAAFSQVLSHPIRPTDPSSGQYVHPTGARIVCPGEQDIELSLSADSTGRPVATLSSQVSGRKRVGSLRSDWPEVPGGFSYRRIPPTSRFERISSLGFTPAVPLSPLQFLIYSQNVGGEGLSLSVVNSQDGSTSFSFGNGGGGYIFEPTVFLVSSDILNPVQIGSHSDWVDAVPIRGGGCVAVRSDGFPMTCGQSVYDMEKMGFACGVTLDPQSFDAVAVEPPSVQSDVLYTAVCAAVSPAMAPHAGSGSIELAAVSLIKDAVLAQNAGAYDAFHVPNPIVPFLRERISTAQTWSKVHGFFLPAVYTSPPQLQQGLTATLVAPNAISRLSVVDREFVLGNEYAILGEEPDGKLWLLYGSLLGYGGGRAAFSHPIEKAPLFSTSVTPSGAKYTQACEVYTNPFSIEVTSPGSGYRPDAMPTLVISGGSTVVEVLGKQTFNYEEYRYEVIDADDKEVYQYGASCLHGGVYFSSSLGLPSSVYGSSLWVDLPSVSLEGGSGSGAVATIVPTASSYVPGPRPIHLSSMPSQTPSMGWKSDGSAAVGVSPLAAAPQEYPTGVVKVSAAYARTSAGQIYRTGLGVTPSRPYATLQAEVSLDSGGRNFSLPPVISVSQPHSSIASVEAVIDGKLVSLGVDNAGSGYRSAPTLTITAGQGGGSGATAKAVISGPVDKVTVTNGGSGYVVPPKVSLATTGSPGSLAVGMKGEVSSVVLVSGGVGYTDKATVSFSGTGQGAAAKCNVGSGGKISSITVTSPGSGYTSPPSVKIEDTTGTGARAIAKVSLSVDSLSIIDGGQYREPPSVRFDPDCTVASVSVNAEGSGYTSAPLVRIVDLRGLGSGATAEAVVSEGKVTSVVVTSVGSEYDANYPPVVVFIGGGGTGATAAVTLENAGSGAEAQSRINGRILYAKPVNAGSGYQFSPTVTISGGDNESIVELDRQLLEGEITQEEYDSQIDDLRGVVQARIEGTISSVVVKNAGECYVGKGATPTPQQTFPSQAFSFQWVSGGVTAYGSEYMSASAKYPGSGVSPPIELPFLVDNFANLEATFYQRPLLAFPNTLGVYAQDYDKVYVTSSGMRNTIPPVDASQKGFGVYTGITTPGAFRYNLSSTPTLVALGQSYFANVSAVRFESPPSLSIYSEGGSGMEAAISLDATGKASSASVTKLGQGYSTVTTRMKIEGGVTKHVPCEVACTVSGGKVSSVAVSASGSGYVAPEVFVHGGGGSGASVSLATEPDAPGSKTFKISAVNLVSAGSGYASAPQITVRETCGRFSESPLGIAVNASLASVMPFAEQYDSQPTAGYLFDVATLKCQGEHANTIPLTFMQRDPFRHPDASDGDIMPTVRSSVGSSWSGSNPATGSGDLFFKITKVSAVRWRLPDDFYYPYTSPPEFVVESGPREEGISLSSKLVSFGSIYATGNYVWGKVIE